MDKCIFCDIINKKIPTEFVYEDEHIVVFKDIFPKADVHLLAVPKKHIVSLREIQEQDKQLIAHITFKLQDIAKDAGLKHGFRTIINTGPGGGQEIDHLHYHIIGGSTLVNF